MKRLLHQATARGLSARYVGKLLDAFLSADSENELIEPPETSLLEEPLSERELEVLHHLESYLSAPEIADILMISANTVRSHIKSIYAKLGVHGRSEAVKRAGELRLLT